MKGLSLVRSLSLSSFPMLNLTTFIEETAALLGLPPFLPENGETIGLTFAPHEMLSLDLSNWPLVTLYRSITLPPAENLTQHYLRILSLNADLDGATLASDEAGLLHLVLSFNATERPPAEFASCLKQFATLGAEIPDRFATPEDTASLELLGNDRETSHPLVSALPPEYRIFA